MPEPNGTAPLTQAVEEAVERQIACRTGHRVHQLRVHAVDGRMIVQGLVPSYYIKQLAIQAVVDVLGPATSEVADLDLEVIAAPLP